MAKIMFILKRDLVFNDTQSTNRYKRLQTYVETKRDIDQMVNMNVQHMYVKGYLVEKGDYVTCCHIEESIHPDESFTLWREGSWKKDKVFQINDVLHKDYAYAVYPEKDSGVYACGVRLSTEEEIENYKKSQNG